MFEYTKEEEVVLLYFMSMGFNSKSLSNLLAHKCRSTRSARSVHQKWKSVMIFGGRWNSETNKPNLHEVGEYLADLMPDTIKFEELISFGSKEEEIATATASCDCYSSRSSTLISRIGPRSD